MNDFNQNYDDDVYVSKFNGSETTSAADTDRVVTKSFLFMFAALLITGFAAFNTSLETAISMLEGQTAFLLFIVEIAIVIAADYALAKSNVVLGGILFLLYSYLNGMTLSIILYIYTAKSIELTFLITAVMFGGFAVFGMLTKKDLTGIGSICLMGLFGIILAGIVNLFVGNEYLDLGVTIIGIIIFVGLTAYDVQKVKTMAATSEISNENAIGMMGALQLYLDFINLFLKLLRLMGKRKN